MHRVYGKRGGGRIYGAREGMSLRMHASAIERSRVTILERGYGRGEMVWLRGHLPLLNIAGYQIPLKFAAGEMGLCGV